MGDVVALGDRLVVVRDAEGIAQHQAELRRARYADKARPRRAKQRAKRLLRIPPWADLGAIAAVYRECAEKCRRTGREYEVDHIVPLLGENVSGLHVANNLRIITKRANRKKRNRFDPEELVGGAGFEPATPSV